MALNYIAVCVLQLSAALLFITLGLLLTFLMNECVLYECTFKISKAAFINDMHP